MPRHYQYNVTMLIVGVFGHTVEEHNVNLHQLVQTCSTEAHKHGMVFNCDKCKIKTSKCCIFWIGIRCKWCAPRPRRIDDDIRSMGNRADDADKLRKFINWHRDRHNSLHPIALDEHSSAPRTDNERRHLCLELITQPYKKIESTQKSKSMRLEKELGLF